MRVGATWAEAMNTSRNTGVRISIDQYQRTVQKNEAGTGQCDDDGQDMFGMWVGQFGSFVHRGGQRIDRRSRFQA